jgi:superfamily II DNA or RNA helicase
VDVQQAQVQALARMAFRFPFRRYQSLALSWLEATVGTDADDRRYHMVAPPGSGKTILGLEMIRRFGRPALVLAPTTAIQEQWREQARLFLGEDEPVDGLASTDSARLAPITVLTYQSLSTSARADEPLDALARERWCHELVDASKVADLDEAGERLDRMRANNPDAFRRELARRHRRVKRELLRSGEADIVRFLHDNARALLDRLVAHEVGTIVLDECHHLLDHWAVVVRHLTGRLDAPCIVGLTATLPDPETPQEYENYTALLGDVDFEVPTPAVVKEGELAPYRDLVRFVEPTERESAYLRDIQGEFESALSGLTGDERFLAWLRDAVGVEEPDHWSALLREDPLWAIAAMRVLHALGVPVDERLVVPVEAEEPPTPRDRAEVVARYGLRELKVSPDEDDHARLASLRRALQPFGFLLTERGLRQSRSPGDLVLAYSEAKQEAAAEILEAERAALGERLRAIVVTDFERAGRAVARAGEALVADAGSARHTFRTLIAHPPLRDLDPVLITGSTLWVDADVADALVDKFSSRLQAMGANAACRATLFDGERIAELRGEGPDWSTRTYVRLVTDAFERGITRCLVGTRGLLGEGWDALRLNTLIDLTSVTTAQSVQQLRGRSLRLDPSWPRKVAHNWDVVCVATEFDGGDRDLRRFAARHDHFWGVVPMSRPRALYEEAAAGAGALLAGIGADELGPPPRPRGEIMKGVAHVDPDLAWQLLTRPWKRVRYERVNRRSMRAIGDRDASYELWGVGDPYENADRWAARLDARELTIRTAHTITDTLRSLLRAFRASLLGGALLIAFLVARLSLELWGAGAGADEILATASWVVLVGVVGTLGLNARAGWRILRRLVSEQPSEEIAGDVGRAVLVGLRDAGLVSPTLIPEHVRVAEQPDGTVDVVLQLAPAADAEVFVQALGQVFGPIEDPRYLILRDDRQLSDWGLRWLWRPLRRVVGARAGPSYHAVPDVLGVNRGRAEAYAAAWSEHVGGGELVYTRSEDGWRALLDARATERPTATTWSFRRWS